MFGKMLKTEVVRAFRPWKILLTAGLIALGWICSDMEGLRYRLLEGYTETLGSVEWFWATMGQEALKCVMVILLAGLYTNSFCKDNNSSYLRMILTRTDAKTYTICRFLANFCVILVTSVMAYYLLVLLLRPWMPLLPNTDYVDVGYYSDMALAYPLWIVGITGLTFGLVSAASSSIGLLYSAYKSNSFVSIALSGLIFWIAMDYNPFGSRFFDWNGLVSMVNMIGRDVPIIYTFLWSIVYMLGIVGICGFLFYRRMKWRVKNGYI